MIEVGEYIRIGHNPYEGEIIRRVIARDRITKEILLDINYNGYNYLTKDEEEHDIKKHSKNIKDIIEDGDLITYRTKEFGENIYVVPIKYYRNPKNDKEGLWIDDNLSLEQVEILSILTYEQYEGDCYRVEED